MSEHEYLIGELLRELPCGCHPRLESLGGPARFSGGCGTPVIAPEAIVCADCGAWYCSRACISRHFEKEPNEALESKDAELAEMRTALEKALAAFRLWKTAEDVVADCDNHEPSAAPETCELCFPFCDDARLALRAAHDVVFRALNPQPAQPEKP